MMHYLVALGGLLMMALSAAAMLAPRSFVTALSKWSANARFFLTVGVRLVLGIIFLLGASQTRFPTFISIVGMITLAAAIILFILGRAKVDAMIQWWFHRTSRFMRMWALVGVILGAWILYAAF